MTSLLIHAPVSVAQSLRTSLSNELWRFGPGIFDIAGVPFASSTGKDRAYRLCRLLKFFAENDHVTFSSMTEYGVGSGILSWHVLTLLRQHFPDIYDQIQIRLTDGSIDLLEQLLVQRHWSSHRHKVSAHAVNITEPDTDPCFDTSFAYSTYLLCCLPVRDIEIVNGKVYEWLVQTSIDKSATLVDTAGYLPRILNARQIVRLSREPHSKRRLLYAGKLLELVQETYTRVPIEQSPGLEGEEYEDLMAYIQSFKALPELRFNYSFAAGRHIQSVLTRLKPEGAYLINDFGHASTINPLKQCDLFSSYGNATFYSIFFPYLIYKAQAAGAQCAILRTMPTNYELICYKGSRFSVCKTLFEQAFNKLGQAQAVFEKRLARLTPEDSMQTVLKYHRRLPLYERVNHHVLGRLAVFAFKREAWKVSIYYTKKSLEGYRHVAARAYFRIGLCYQEMGQHSKALVNFKKFIKMAPYLKDPYWELMQYYFNQKNHKAVLSALKKCIRYSQDNEVWPLYIALAQAYLKDGKTQQAHRILRRIQDLDKSHPGHIPDSVLRSIPS